MTLRIIYACIHCRCLFEHEVYDLRRMWGKPTVCRACRVKP